MAAPFVRSRPVPSAKEPDPSKLRKVICSTCGDETGEVALDPVGTCGGCRTLGKHGLFNPGPLHQDDDEYEEAEDDE